MANWQVQDAKARFSELLEAAVKHGPQTVTKRGVETAVLVAASEWRRLQHSARPSLKQLLLDNGPRFEFPIHKSRRLRRRRTVEFE
jgi:antitoxin Phd